MSIQYKRVVPRMLRRLKRRIRQWHSALAWRTTCGTGHAADMGIVGELMRDGIAITDVDRLCIPDATFRELCDTSLQLRGQHLELGQSQSRDLHKTSFTKLLDQSPIDLNQPSPFLDVALHQPTLSIVNEYLGCYSQLADYNVWWNQPQSGDASYSQLWHRDFEDRSMIKMFIVLQELTNDNGPFHFARGTHSHGAHANRDAASEVDGMNAKRSTDEQMRGLVPEHEWVKVNGPPGTVFLADTNGYHKGGFVRTGDRLLFMMFYTRWTSIGSTRPRCCSNSVEPTDRATQWAVR